MNALHATIRAIQFFFAQRALRKAGTPLGYQLADFQK